MVALPFSLRRSRVVLFAAMALTVGAGCGFTPAVCAQQQESGFLDRLDHPDRTLKYSPADKQFAVSSNDTGRQATVRSFAFSRPANLRAGDGAFSTHAYNGTDSFRTKDFATHKALGTSQGFSQSDKQFGTRGFDVKEDRAANKAAIPVHDYVPADKPYLGRGRRQDSIDELRKQKNLTIDQVREILNKSR